MKVWAKSDEKKENYEFMKLQSIKKKMTYLCLILWGPLPFALEKKKSGIYFPYRKSFITNAP